ncbi:MAG: hypothetical protein QOG72_3396 [Sphingomonadales bacterium]|jgi:hypothetical protein|nr:hypothetical protein [Sphingomonadales bacterium]
MRSLALLAIWAVSAAAAAPGPGVPLQALTEADVGAGALENSACYVHDGPAVLVVATVKNAVVNSDGDLLLLDRLDDDGFPSGGARYGSNTLKVVIAPAPGPVDDVAASGRTDQSAQISVRKRGSTKSITARWSCNPRRGA